jgi:hypothetical protein
LYRAYACHTGLHFGVPHLFSLVAVIRPAYWTLDQQLAPCRLVASPMAHTSQRMRGLDEALAFARSLGLDPAAAGQRRFSAFPARVANLTSPLVLRCKRGTTMIYAMEFADFTPN